MLHALARGAIVRHQHDAVMRRYELRHEVLRAAVTNRVRVRPSNVRHLPSSSGLTHRGHAFAPRERVRASPKRLPRNALTR